MRQGAVGQKCPRCARTPRSARALGRPVHYVRAGVAGAGMALGGGIAVNILLEVLPFGAIVLPAFLGFGVGRVVGWGAHRQRSTPFVTLAVVLAVVGAVVGLAGFPVPRLAVLGNPFALMGMAAAGWFARRGLYS